MESHLAILATTASPMYLAGNLYQARHSMGNSLLTINGNCKHARFATVQIIKAEIPGSVAAAQDVMLIERQKHATHVMGISPEL